MNISKNQPLCGRLSGYGRRGGKSYRIRKHAVRLYHLIISAITSAKSHQRDSLTHDLDLVNSKSHAKVDKRNIMRSQLHTQKYRHGWNSEKRRNSLPQEVHANCLFSTK